MEILVLWWAGIFFEALLLVRAAKSAILRTYPLFSLYIACTLAGEVTLFVIYKVFSASAYQHAYWTRELICVLAGYCLVMEVLERSLKSYEGPRRLARNAGLVVFASVVGLTTVQWFSERHGRFLRTTVEVERNLRGGELVLLALIIGTVFYYSIPITRNLKGIILGYGFCVATIVMGDAFRSYAGSSFQTIFSYVRSYSYLVSLLIWTVALWSYDAHPASEQITQLAGDYEALANWTRGALVGARGYLRKAARL
jgi:hypothetical protein